MTASYCFRCLLPFFLLLTLRGWSQEGVGGTTDSLQKLDALYRGLAQKSSRVEAKLDRQTARYLHRFQKQEEALFQKLLKKDSTLASQLFAATAQNYAALARAPQKGSKYAQVYAGHLDTLTTALHFLKTQAGDGLPSPGLQAALDKYKSLQQKLNGADAIKNYVKERQQRLKEQLTSLGMVKDLQGLQKAAYYYSQQVNEYRQLFADPSRLEQKLVSLVMGSSAFKQFFAQHSLLGSLFALPGAGGNDPSRALSGLQTRASVQQQLISRFGSVQAAGQAVQQGVSQAQGELTKLQNKLTALKQGSVGEAGELPEGFKPNPQKTKSFLKRLEYGVNLSSSGSSSFFPVTTDVGVSVGYKLNDGASVGVGLSYKLGWGRGWDDIRLTSEGIGVRSYVDVRLKGSFYLAGGYEWNYRSQFETFAQLKDESAWQRSGLLGLSKKYQVSRKLKGDLRLLWDFLSYSQTPQTTPFVFRVGYSLK